MLFLLLLMGAGSVRLLRLYMFVYAVSVTGTSLVGLSFETALSAVATTMGGVGPGMADVGRIDNFNFIHALGKFILTWTCSPAAWRSTRCCCP